ncbi:MAG TPA: SH3 domain-containing protein [Ramlibacter sp.]|uniref:SH3 domain-containing protein n=1 Tax=Ramlibacter sp. TaxID=1917967 RepID=UPI002D0D7E14|nr:SH3 domain-containing protein [Ramlibacter sp.]HVZ45698.1 SH3 domain-containing protein [Ramlibacter sp.]
MKSTILAVASALSLGAFVPAAQAQQIAYSSTPLTLRAGPDPMYPPVVTLPAGMQVSVQGCLAGYTWCDVIAGLDRGWVWGGSLNYPYQGSYVALPNVAGLIGLGILGFALDDYWSAHYAHRPFYAQRHRYEHRAPSMSYYYNHDHDHGHNHGNDHDRGPVVRHEAPHVAPAPAPQAILGMRGPERPARAAPAPRAQRETHVMGGPPAARIEHAQPNRGRGPAGGPHGHRGGDDRDHRH